MNILTLTLTKEITDYFIQWALPNMITLGHRKTDSERKSRKGTKTIISVLSTRYFQFFL